MLIVDTPNLDNNFVVGGANYNFDLITGDGVLQQPHAMHMILPGGSLKCTNAVVDNVLNRQ